MDVYDVIIVGAGPAGSTAAFYIEGKKVLIVDKSEFPRYKACGGGLLGARDWNQEFQNFAQIESHLNYHRVNFGTIYFNQIELFSRRTHFFDHVERLEFDKLLLQEALKKPNVEFRQFKVTKIKKRGEQIFVSNGDEVIEAKSIIGADGATSVVSRFLGNKPFNINQAARCIGYDVQCERHENTAFISLLWQNEIGFAWLFPTKRGYNLGAGNTRQRKRSVSKYNEDWLEYCIAKGLIPKKHRLEKRFGGLDPVYVPRHYCSESVLLAGDAMGLVYQFNGEGIYFAMKSGKIAGQLISSGKLLTAYKPQIRPVIKDVTVVPWVPWRGVTVPLFWVVFSFMRLRLPWVQTKLHNLTANIFLRRYNLPPGSQYKRL